jgi:cytochrome c553
MNRSRQWNRALASLLMLMSGGAIHAQPDFIDLRHVDPVIGNGEAVREKAVVCSACHGPVGVSVVPTFPSIAGQSAEYLYWQLVEFKREARPESPMTALVMTLSDQDMRDYAAYFAALAPAQPTSAADAATSDRGAQLYREGDAQAGIPPCQGCHGAAAAGHPLATEDVRYRVYPSLRGQHTAYVAQRLKEFRDGKHTLTSTDRIMQGVAQHISDGDAQALADWVQSAPR